MIPWRLSSLVLAGLSIGCAGTRVPLPTQTPTAATSAPEPVPPIISSTGSWSFKYALGSLSYQITRSATVERVDSLNQKEITTNSAHELLMLESATQGIGFTALVDTFTTTTQGSIGTVQPVQLPVQISGSLATDTLTINSQVNSVRCNPVSTVLITDLHNLLVPFPAIMSAGMSWKDSVNVQGCQSGIQTVSHVVRSFAVSGEVMFEGKPAVLILRTDTTRSQGEGGLQQHRISLSTTGTGTAAYYLSSLTGQVAHLTLNQTLDLGVTTSDREYHFKQSSKQEFRLAP